VTDGPLPPGGGCRAYLRGRRGHAHPIARLETRLFAAPTRRISLSESRERPTPLRQGARLASFCPVTHRPLETDLSNGRPIGFVFPPRPSCGPARSRGDPFPGLGHGSAPSGSTQQACVRLASFCRSTRPLCGQAGPARPGPCRGGRTGQTSDHERPISWTSTKGLDCLFLRPKPGPGASARLGRSTDRGATGPLARGVRTSTIGGPPSGRVGVRRATRSRGPVSRLV